MASGPITSIYVSIYNAGTGAPGPTLDIYADNGNSLGALVATFSGTFGPGGNPPDLLTVGTGSLTSGHVSWAVTPGAIEGGMAWQASHSYVQTNSHNNGSYDLSGLPAMGGLEILVATPEPTTAALALGGMVILGGAQLFRRRQLARG